MLINVGKSDTHDMSDIEALDAHFAKRRDDELAATMAAEAAKTDVARSAARATLIKRAGVATSSGRNRFGCGVVRRELSGHAESPLHRHRGASHHHA